MPSWPALQGMQFIDADFWDMKWGLDQQVTHWSHPLTCTLPCPAQTPAATAVRAHGPQAGPMDNLAIRAGASDNLATVMSTMSEATSAGEEM